MTTTSSKETRIASGPALHVLAPGVIHQDAPHDPRRNCEKMRAVLPLHAREVNQTHVGFVDQGSCLQTMAGALASHIVVGQATEFLVNGRRQPLERALVSFAPGAGGACLRHPSPSRQALPPFYVSRRLLAHRCSEKIYSSH